MHFVDGYGCALLEEEQRQQKGVQGDRSILGENLSSGVGGTKGVVIVSDLAT